MDTLIPEFADLVFSFLALKYEIIAMNIPREVRTPVEEQDWNTTDNFTVDVGHAVLMLSYSYRTSFRNHFRLLSKSLVESKDHAKLYTGIFARVTYKCHSPIKILIIVSFISELYLFLFFKCGSKSAIKDYLAPAVDCFKRVYENILKTIEDPVPKWKEVLNVATKIASGYKILEPIMDTEHPSETKSKPFLASVESVVKAKEGKLADVPLSKEEMLSKATKYVEQVNKDHPPNTRVDPAVYEAFKAESQRFISNLTQSEKNGKKSSSKDPLKPQDSLRKKTASELQASVKETSPLQPAVKVDVPADQSPSKTVVVNYAIVVETYTKHADFSFGTVDEIAKSIPGFNAEGKAVVFQFDNANSKIVKDSGYAKLKRSNPYLSNIKKTKTVKGWKKNIDLIEDFSRNQGDIDPSIILFDGDIRDIINNGVSGDANTTVQRSSQETILADLFQELPESETKNTTPEEELNIKSCALDSEDEQGIEEECFNKLSHLAIQVSDTECINEDEANESEDSAV